MCKGIVVSGIALIRPTIMWLEQFERGVYNLNREEFPLRWENAPSATASEDALLHDPDSDDLDTDEIGKVTVWEWHGRVQPKKGTRNAFAPS